jgi:hypothetical protein
MISSFADVHYYYGPPSAKPPHHRFDKGSYVYLFENAGQRRARIEIANNAGTPEQDAFTGCRLSTLETSQWLISRPDLDGALVQYSYKNTNLVTLTVDGQTGQPTPTAGTEEWHLPTFDPRNENKYMYRLHTVDMYFWSKEDALQLVNGVRRVLPAQQISVKDEPVAPPAHHEAMSPVVQKLENVAISDPSYQQGRTRDSRTTSAFFPGPPISATPQSREASNFAPMAYNPAAPAAPEVIKHREKTPPPEDGAANPLMAAAAADQGQPIAPSYVQRGFSGPPGQQAQGGYFPGPPVASAPPSQFAQPAPPPSTGLQSPFAQHFQNTFAPPPTAPTPTNPYSQPPPAYQQQAQPPSHIPVTQFADYPGSPGLSSGMTTPGVYSPGFPSQMPNLGVQSPGAPPGGFAQYNYNNSISNTRPLNNDYSIHSQVYRPTEFEAAHGHKPGKAAKPPAGKLEAKAVQVEKGVNSIFKRLEKKIG